MKLISFLIFAIILTSCSSLDFGPLRPQPYLPETLPQTRFMVISDTHLYSQNLGVIGSAWEEYLGQDRKLLAESEEILGEAVKLIIQASPQFLIISGDLTKDGERVNHELLATYLQTIEDKGIQVYVIPGNHDIDNPHAKGFGEKGAFPVATVSTQDFAGIYQNFGFSQAFSRDQASLSYAVDCAPGLVLLALDTCIYEDNQAKGKPTTDGRLRPQTLIWLKGVLAQVQAQGKTVIVTQHHAVLEHFEGALTFMGAYIVDQNREIAEFLSREGVKLVFTGHGHSQDITTGVLTDVETGSLVTFPCPIREVILTGASAQITSQFITSLPSFTARNTDFRAYAMTYARLGIKGFAAKVAKERLGFSELEAYDIADQAAKAMMGHYVGDEVRVEDIEGVWNTSRLGLWAGFVAGFLRPTAHSLYKDLPPADNQTTITW